MNTNQRHVYYSVSIEGLPSYRCPLLGFDFTRKDVRAFTGLVRVEAENFKDIVLENPTWGDLEDAAERQIWGTGNFHHRFLENAHIVWTDAVGNKLVQVVELVMGS